MTPENEPYPNGDPNQSNNQDAQDALNQNERPSESISIEPVISDISAPKPYSIRIHVTSSQQANARLLSNIVSEEGNPQSPGRPARYSSLRPLYIGIGLLLILAISWSSIFGSPSAAYATIPPEVLDFQQHLQTLPPSTSVLIGFDYEPGFSGELDGAASAVLSMLFTRQIYPVLVATNPTGVIQAERVISTIESSLSIELDPIIDYINLGYIPGGSVSLGSMANSLRSTIPYDLTGNPVWENPALSDVKSVDDFASLIVISNSADTGRDWIEQISPVLGSTPMLFIVSEQAGPIIKPYYQADPNQVQGLLIGIYGAASFENISGLTNVARIQWDSYSIGILAIAAIILIGGLISAVSAASKPMD